MNILDVRNLNISFKNFNLNNITFSLPAGYIMGYVGQNGAGKTTTIKLITHLLKPDSGEVSVNGIRYQENPLTYKESIGYIGDESYFPDQFTLKNVRSVLKDFYPGFDKVSFDRYIEQWRLPNNIRVSEFSRGNKVKLMFASALSRDTKLLILDEATNGLDPVVRREILELLQEYISDGKRSVLFSTHLLYELEQIADYIFFINNGEKILFDSKDDLLENYRIVKGGNEELTENLAKELIGITKKSVGFEALGETNKAAFLKNRFIIEKPSIDQIVFYIIKEMGKTGGAKWLQH